MPKEIENIIVSEYISGKSTIDIYKEYSICTTVTQDILKRNGVPLRGKEKVTDVDIQFMIELYKELRSYEKVGKVLGVRGNNISSYINKYLKES